MSADVDGELRVTEEGLEIPEEIVGYVGEFQIRTPNVDGVLTTTYAGLPEFLSVLGEITESGDYNEDLEAGQIAISADGFPEKVYRQIDDRGNSEELRPDGGPEERMLGMTVSLPESGTVSITKSGGNVLEKVFDLEVEPGSYVEITGPDGFTLRYDGPPPEADEE